MTKRVGDTRLALGMLALGLAGALVGVLRAVLLEGPRWWSLLIGAPALLAPLCIVVALVIWTRNRTAGRWRVAAAWGGWAAALGAAGLSVTILDPAMNRDANIGLGLYTMFGSLYPLGPVALLGVLAGLAWECVRPSTSQAVQADPIQPGSAGPLGPWLWGLGLPALAFLVGQVRNTAALATALPDKVQTVWLSMLPVVLLSLLTDLGPLLLPLVLLRLRVAQTGRPRERLWGFWGVCLGWAAGTLAQHWPGGLAGLGFVALYPLTALLMLLGYLGGKQLARRRI